MPDLSRGGRHLPSILGVRMSYGFNRLLVSSRVSLTVQSFEGPSTAPSNLIARKYTRFLSFFLLSTSGVLGTGKEKVGTNRLVLISWLIELKIF